MSVMILGSKDDPLHALFGDRIELVIQGTPKGKARHRFDPRTKRTYPVKETVLGELEIRNAWEAAGSKRMPDVALKLSVFLNVVRPQSHWRKDGKLSREGERNPIPANRKPDMDNALKLVMDALNGCAYRDDVQVAEVWMIRRWAEWPSTAIVLETLPAVL